MFKKTILLISFLNISFLVNAQKTFIEAVDTLVLEMNKEDIFFNADANDDYFIFHNYTTKKLNIYSLKTSEHYYLDIKKGEGINETEHIADLKIDEDNFIYTLDINLHKLLKFDIEGTFYNDSFFSLRLFLINLLNHKNEFYSASSRDYKLGSYYHHISFTDNNRIKLTPLFPEINTNIKVVDLAFLYFSGYSDINDHHIVHGRKHYSIFNVYPLDTTKEMSVIEYDEYQEFELLSEDGKTKTIYPPSIIYVELNALFLHPTNDSKVYINAEGSTSNMIYDKYTLYEYDLKKRVFTNSYVLGYTPASLARHNDMLYILPKFDDKFINEDEVFDKTNVYIYKILD